LTDTSMVDGYSLSATIKADVDGYVQADDVYIGLVAYYADSGNFVVIYLQWDEQNCLKSMGCTGMIDGNDLGWHDMWAFDGVETHLTQGETLFVSRSVGTFNVAYGGVSANVTLSELVGKECSSVGLWCCKTTCTYDDIEMR